MDEERLLFHIRVLHSIQIITAALFFVAIFLAYLYPNGMRPQCEEMLSCDVQRMPTSAAYSKRKARSLFTNRSSRSSQADNGIWLKSISKFEVTYHAYD